MIVDGDFELNNPSLQARSRQISFSSTIAETFSVSKKLTEDLAAYGMKYWKDRGLTVKNVSKPDDFSNTAPSVEFVAEGGTIWTTDFASYKKTVKVSLVGNPDHTEVMVRIVLPGGLMSIQDREKAAGLIDSFYNALENARP